MKRLRKTISIIVTLAMIMSLLLPVGAMAATSNDLTSKKTVDDSFDSAVSGTLSTLQITEDSSVANDFVYGNSFVVTLPDGVEFTCDTNGDGKTDKNDNALALLSLRNNPEGAAAAVGAAIKATFSDERTMNIQFISNKFNNDAVEQTLSINFDVKIDGFTGDMYVNIDPLDSGITGGDILIGRVVSSGETTNAALSVESIGEGGTETGGIIRITEGAAGNFKAASYIELTLSSGFKWVTTGTKKTEVTLLGGLDSQQSNILVGVTNTDANKLKIDFKNITAPSNTRGIVQIEPVINVDSDADYGDVEVDIDGEDVTSGSLVIANYGDYGVTVTADSVEDVIAGKAEQELGKLIIEENIPGTMVDGRKVTIALPDWAKLQGNITATRKSGDNLGFTSLTRDPDDFNEAYCTISRTAANPDTAAKYELDFNDVSIKAGSTGDLAVTLTGSAGIEDGTEVVVAKAINPITANAETKEVKLGVQQQAIGDITITENVKGAITDDPTTGIGATNNEKQIELVLPTGGAVQWAATPKVEVTEGNLNLGTVSKSGDNLTIKIKIDGDSTKPSTIKVTGGVVNVDRTVATGAVEVAIKGGAIAENYKDGAEESEVTFDARTQAKVYPANIVNAAPSAGSATFNIGSSVYYENGVAKVMDAAPYIKDGRTYVPVRFLAMALGVSEDNIGFENGVVTLKKGDVTVKLTIGDMNVDVNGTVNAMDVAPEVNNGRTMLPARFVGEAFGAQVGFANGTVVISY